MWHLESIAERGRAMRTFVCTVPETGRRVTTDNGESLQGRERLCAGRSIRLFQRKRAKQAYAQGDLEGVMRGQRYCTCAFRPRQVSPFYPVTSRTLFRSQPRGSKVARNNRSSRGPGNEAMDPPMGPACIRQLTPLRHWLCT